MLFPDNYELSGNSDYKCLSGDKAQQKLVANSLPDKPKSMEYSNML